MFHRRAIMNTALAASEAALVPAPERRGPPVRRVSDLHQEIATNDAAFLQAGDIDDTCESHRPMRGILLGVLLGALCWAAIIGAIFAL